MSKTDTRLFLQPDPKHFEAGDFNLYRYCGNDPINRVDPLGLYFVYSYINPADAVKAHVQLAQIYNAGIPAMQANIMAMHNSSQRIVIGNTLQPGTEEAAFYDNSWANMKAYAPKEGGNWTLPIGEGWRFRDGDGRGSGSGSFIFFDPNNNVGYGGAIRFARRGLAHELGHAILNLFGMSTRNRGDIPAQSPEQPNHKMIRMSDEEIARRLPDSILTEAKRGGR